MQLQAKWTPRNQKTKKGNMKYVQRCRFGGSEDRKRDRQYITASTPRFQKLSTLPLWQYGLLSFQTGYTKLGRFLHKNHHTQRKLLNVENWTNGEPLQLAKSGACYVDYFILPIFLLPKLRSVAQNEWKKHPYCIVTSRSTSRLVTCLGLFRLLMKGKFDAYVL